MTEKGTSRFETLDGLRGYFVLLTFLVHYVPNAAGFLGVGYLEKSAEQRSFFDSILLWLHQSNYGVYGFFALSAFLIGRMIKSARFCGSVDFLIHRFFRIYPAFFVSLIVSGAIGFFYTHYIQINAWQAIQNLFFLNGFFMIGEIPSLNFVTWSLFYEAVFYLTVPLIVLIQQQSGSRRNLILILVLPVVVATSYFLKLGYSYTMFYAGFAMAQFSDDELNSFARKVPEIPIGIAYLAATTAYSLNLLSLNYFVCCYFFLCTLLIVKANFDSDGFFHKIFNVAWLKNVGKISYSFYLLHACIIIGVFYLLNSLIGPSQRVIWTILSLPIVYGITFFGSKLLYRFAEEPYFARRVTLAPKFGVLEASQQAA